MKSSVVSYWRNQDNLEGFLLAILMCGLLIMPTSASSNYCQKPNASNCIVTKCTLLNTDIECNFNQKYLQLQASQGEVSITCNNADINYAWLEGISLNYIQEFSLQYCPMPNISLHNFLAKFGTVQVSKILLHNIINSNKINDEFLKHLYNVTHLLMTQNELTQLPENLFQDMINLVNLDLSFNNLTLTDNELQNLTRLRKLELGSNNIYNLSSNAFANLTNLEFLNLWNNKLSHLSRSMFSDLANVKSLDISGNQISFIFPDTFTDMRNLSIINLAKNKFTALPLLFTSNPKLQVVKLSHNSKLSNLPPGFLSHLPLLQNISITYCNISVLPEDILWESPNISSLDLSHNSLSTLLPLTFRDATKLKYFYISYNNLMSLPGSIFIPTKKLYELRMSHNMLSEIDTHLFESLQELQILFLDQNKLTNTSVNAFRELKQLKEMNLAHNQLSFSNSIRDMFGPWSPIQYCSNLQVLDLSYNNITEIFADWIFALLNLKTLNLSFNKIHELQAEDLQFIAKEKLTVNLENNNISHISLTYLENIASESVDKKYPTEVKLSENPLDCDCYTYNILKYLEKKMRPYVYKMVDLRVDNLICSRPHDTANISIINLTSDTFLCPIEILKCPSKCNCHFDPHKKSIKVNCFRAGLNAIPDLVFNTANVKFPIELLLDYNNINHLPTMLPQIYEKVTKMSLSHNAISYLNISSLPPNLKLLRLDNNNLTHIDPSILQTWTNKTNVTLHGNPWSCDCDDSTLDLFNFLQGSYKQVEFLNNITCKDGRSLALLTSDDICSSAKAVIIAISIGIAAVGIIIGLLAGLYFRYQTAIKVWLYAHNMCLWFVTEEELDKDKIYDAFVSYSHHDEDFITNSLLPELETGVPQFKLCVHYRDWIAGEFITTQISRSVEDSRRTIIVLSENFIKSEWGRLEFRAAHKQALIEGRARVIVIVYGDIGSLESLDSELRTYLSTNTYVKWGDPWFWNKIKYALPHHTKKPKAKLGQSDKLELIQSTSTITTTPPADITANPLELKFSSTGCKTTNEIKLL